MQSTELNWPPAYNVRYSQRASRINLKFCAIYGLQIIVPKSFRATCISDVLEKNRDWILRTQHKIKSIVPINNTIETLPSTINLLALNYSWQVSYEATAASVLHLKQVSTNHIHISGCLENKNLIKKLLQDWLKRIAQKKLVTRLYVLSVTHNLPFAKVSIRNAQTHWGSCNAKKNISLSTQLLFVAPELVDYVLIHELCHTKFLNHSERFWNLCASIVPNYKDLRKQLRVAQHALPAWLQVK